jgi:putative transcription factor
MTYHMFQSHSGNNEDWDTVVLKKPEKRQDAQAKIARGGQCNAEVRVGAAQNTQKSPSINTRVLDENTDGGHIKTVYKNTAQALRDGRLALNLTQKALAAKVNILPNLLADYEAQKAIPDQKILTKLEGILGIYLRGDKCGQKIEKTVPKNKQ